VEPHQCHLDHCTCQGGWLPPPCICTGLMGDQGLLAASYLTHNSPSTSSCSGRGSGGGRTAVGHRVWFASRQQDNNRKESRLLAGARGGYPLPPGLHPPWLHAPGCGSA
jgi:hypothetical protein